MHEILQVFHASPKLAAVGSVDEAVVIGAALSLSSSAFVLQLLSERGELATKFGSATLGILLLQVRRLRYTALPSNHS
jgi:Kef-type K+ transport system membrane component KefB